MINWVSDGRPEPPELESFCVWGNHLEDPDLRLYEVEWEAVVINCSSPPKFEGQAHLVLEAGESPLPQVLNLLSTIIKHRM